LKGFNNWWWSLSAKRRYLLLGGIAIVLALASYGSIIGSGVTAALDAQERAAELEVQLNSITPLELTQAGTYLALKTKFVEMEKSMDRAHSRLRLLRPLTWIPGIGARISEALILSDIGRESAHLGGNISVTFQRVWDLPLDSISSRDAVSSISLSLQQSRPIILEAEESSRRVKKLRIRLGDSGKGERFGILIDQYLPLVQGVLYLSRSTPDVVGNFHLLSREMSVLRQWADDPLSVMEAPGEVRLSLKTLDDQSLSLIENLDLALLAVRQEPDESFSKDTQEALEIFQQQLALLRRVSRGTDALVSIWQSATESGFLTDEFSRVASVELDRSESEFFLARQELHSLQALQGSQKSSSILSGESALGGGLGSLAVAQGGFEGSLDEIMDFSAFLRSFLGFNEPKTYLFIGQNPNEIRATGGFIGVAVSIKVDQGRMGEPIYYDSTEVDPPLYATNPPAPEGIYWYLWMERLTFRDSNWNPHFPSSAAQIAEIFTAGQGIKIDGVIAASKPVMLDLVELFGDITVPLLSGTMDRERASALMDGEIAYQCLNRHVSSRTKRCFDEDLFFSLRERLQEGADPGLRQSLAQMFRRQIERRDLLIHLFDDKASTFLWEQGWNGAVPIVDHDFLMLVDSSLPGNIIKGVQRSWEYSVTLDVDRPSVAQLRVQYENSNPPFDGVCRQAAVGLSGCFPLHLRILVSPRAQDINAPPIPLHEGSEKLAWGYTDLDTLSVTPQSTSGLTEIAGFFTVEPASILTLPFRYSLQPEVLRSTADGVYEYRLLIQKQPGMDPEPVTIAVQLPRGATLRETTPSHSKRSGRWLVFDMSLKSDTTIVVPFEIN